MVSWLSDDVPSLSGGQRDGRCQALLQAIVDRAPIGIVILGPDALFIHVNPAFERMLGYDTAELLRLGVAGITHPDDFLKDLNLYTELWSGQRDNYQIEKRYFHSDGNVIWGRLTATLTRDAAGQVVNVIGMIEDITAHRRAEDVLARNQAKVQALMQNTNDLLHLFTSHDEFDPVTPLSAPAGSNDCLGAQVKQVLIGEAIDFIKHVEVSGQEVPGSTKQSSSIAGEVDIRLKMMERGLQRIAAELVRAGIVADEPVAPDTSRLVELHKLSPREGEILRLLLTRNKVPEIARALCLSEHTVRNHLKSIYRKVGVSSQAELMVRLLHPSSDSYG